MKQTVILRALVHGLNLKLPLLRNRTSQSKEYWPSLQWPVHTKLKELRSFFDRIIDAYLGVTEIIWREIKHETERLIKMWKEPIAT
jgi:hypothetical protein